MWITPGLIHFTCGKLKFRVHFNICVFVRCVWGASCVLNKVWKQPGPLTIWWTVVSLTVWWLKTTLLMGKLASGREENNHIWLQKQRAKLCATLRWLAWKHRPWNEGAESVWCFERAIHWGSFHWISGLYCFSVFYMKTANRNELSC